MRQKATCHPRLFSYGNGLCKSCYYRTPEQRQKRKAYYLENKDRIRQQVIRYGKCNPEKTKIWAAISRKRNSSRIKDYQSKYYVANKPRLLRRSLEWQRNNPEKRRNIDRKSRYGIDRSEWKRLLDKQCGRCAICQSESKLSIDHDHATRKVRGLLCGKCNRGLGMFHDNFQLLLEAADYVKACSAA